MYAGPGSSAFALDAPIWPGTREASQHLSFRGCPRLCGQLRNLYSMQHVGRADPGLCPGEAQRPERKVPCWASSDEAGVNPTCKTLASANIVQVTIGSTARTQ